ncbi:MAG: hypothetical protein LBE51_04255 [Acidovorax sp.]|jgi:hypothetical protein|nr:hypothetical protein [Acidovorax sp.]MDR3004364.1 hypothetical protein [Acidovorax sp.]
MLESRVHQGDGLQWQGQPSQLRVLSVLPGGDMAGTQALWAACAQLQHQGYPVVVLDGTQKESAESPGLQDLLQPHSGTGYVALPVGHEASHSVATLPAARGLVQLAHRARQQGVRALDLLHRHLRNHALVVIVAPELLLSPVLQGASRPPLLMVPAQGRNVLSSYRALKHLLMHTGLTAKLVTMSPDAGIAHNLQMAVKCAMHHLHVEPLVMQLNPQHPRQLQRWSLQCLEQAEPVAPPQTAAHTEWSH